MAYNFSLIEALIDTWVLFSHGAIEIKQAPPAVALIKRFEYINSDLTAPRSVKNR